MFWFDVLMESLIIFGVCLGVIFLRFYVSVLFVKFVVGFEEISVSWGGRSVFVVIV